MFRGTYELSLDAKGRLAVPSRFRDDLRKLSGGSMVLTTSVGRDRFLLLYTLDEWEKLEARLSGLSDFNPAERAVKNVLLRNAEDLTLDGNGRFVIPQRHRGFAALEKEVSLVGSGSHFEIWSSAVLASKEEEERKLLDGAFRGVLPRAGNYAGRAPWARPGALFQGGRTPGVFEWLQALLIYRCSFMRLSTASP